MTSTVSGFDTLCDCLRFAKTGADLNRLASTLSSPAMRWTEMLSQANRQLVSPTLMAEFRHLGFDQLLPEKIDSFLTEILRLNTVRNQRLRALLLDVVSCCNSAGLTPVLLKGAISLTQPFYRDPGSRMLTDIDILLDADAAETCWDKLSEQGYGSKYNVEEYLDHHHLPPLIRGGAAGYVEVHRALYMPFSTGRAFGQHFRAEDMRRFTRWLLDNALPASLDGLEVLIPSPTARVFHCALHSVIGEGNAYRAGIMPLRSLYELALLQSRFQGEIDWSQMQQLLRDRGQRRLIGTWLYLAHRLFGSPMPTQWTTDARMRLHYIRCRLQLRWGLSMTLTTMSHD